MPRDGYAQPPRDPQAVSRRDLLRLGRGPLFQADIDYDGATERVRAAWERDGREPLLRALEPVAEAVVSLAGVASGQRVLDAASGDGNVASACLARGAHVDACDLAQAMLARAGRRCPDARFTLGDVQALPYPDGAFDAVLSSFGFALAPRPRRTARELVRVCRAGGTVTLAAWAPRGLPADWTTGLPVPRESRPQPPGGTSRSCGLGSSRCWTRSSYARVPSRSSSIPPMRSPPARRPRRPHPLRPRRLRRTARGEQRPALERTVVSARYLLMSGVVKQRPARTLWPPFPGLPRVTLGA